MCFQPQKKIPGCQGGQGEQAYKKNTFEKERSYFPHPLYIPLHDQTPVNDRTPVCRHVWGKFLPHKAALYGVPVSPGPAAAVGPQVNRNKFPCRQQVLPGSLGKPTLFQKQLVRVRAVERIKSLGIYKKRMLQITSLPLWVLCHLNLGGNSPIVSTFSSHGFPLSLLPPLVPDKIFCFVGYFS